MIGAFASTGDVGIYNVAYPLSNLLTITLTAFAFIFMPTISELHSDGKIDEMKRTFEVVSKWILLATLPLFLILVSYPSLVIRNTFGPEYTQRSANSVGLSSRIFRPYDRWSEWRYVNSCWKTTPSDV